jgi:hypothetical protein
LTCESKEGRQRRSKEKRTKKQDCKKTSEAKRKTQLRAGRKDRQTGKKTANAAGLGLRETNDIRV